MRMPPNPSNPAGRPPSGLPAAGPSASAAPGATSKPATGARPAAPTPEEARLVDAIRKGDASAWETLVSRYQSRLYTLCYRMTGHRELAADVCQDAFLKSIQGLDSYDGRAQLATWMTRITINACLSRLRSEKLRRHTSLDLELTGSSADSTMGGPLWRSVQQIREPDAGEGVESNEDFARLRWALGQLDPEQRAIILLRDQRGLDYEQIGEVLSVAVGTVKSRLFRARAALREVLERQEQAFLQSRASGLASDLSDPNDSLS